MKNFTKKLRTEYFVSRVFYKKNRRGLSTVVSTAILLSAVSVMGVMLVAWSNTNLFTKQSEMESSFNEKMNKLNEDLLIENIWFGSNPNIVNVTVNNVGYIGLNVTALTIQNSTDTLVFSFTDGGIAPGDDFSIQETFNWNSGEITDFTVTTQRGNYFSSQEVT